MEQVRTGRERHLKPPQKGEVRNPKGKPKGTKNRSTVLKNLFEIVTTVKDPFTGKETKMTLEERLMMALVLKGLKGDVNAVREAMDSVYGKHVDNVNVVADVREAIASKFPFALPKDEDE